MLMSPHRNIEHIQGYVLPDAIGTAMRPTLMLQVPRTPSCYEWLEEKVRSTYNMNSLHRLFLGFHVTSANIQLYSPSPSPRDAINSTLVPSPLAAFRLRALISAMNLSARGQYYDCS